MGLGIWMLPILQVMAMNSSHNHSSSSSSSSISSSISVHRRHPVLLIPGILGSQLEASWDKADDDASSSGFHFYCPRHSNWTSLWFNLMIYTPGFVDCFVDNLRLMYNETSGRSQSNPGVRVRVPGFGRTETIESLNANTCASGGGGKGACCLSLSSRLFD